MQQYEKWHFPLSDSPALTVQGDLEIRPLLSESGHHIRLGALLHNQDGAPGAISQPQVHQGGLRTERVRTRHPHLSQVCHSDLSTTNIVSETDIY